VVNENFDISGVFEKDAMDLVLSNAAFEHFDDIEKTVNDVTRVCKSGAVAILLIDLQTHSRWIREHDPNNIYRYPRRFYNLFWFRGIPNRVRPYQYRQAFENAGWANISLVPVSTIKAQTAYLGVDQEFSAPHNQMEYLTIALMATKK
jgi:ubiquinone/menaquinone biosynthesis C-methylase UbiE